MNQGVETIILLILLIPLWVFAVPNYEEAEKNIEMINPRNVKNLPQAFKEQLTSERCLIPKVFGSQGVTGWTKGAFARKGQRDWAVLCSNSSGESYVRIFWGDQKPCPEIFGITSNKNFLQVIHQDTVGFSRMIGVVSTDDLVKYLGKANAAIPQTLTQEGIADSFVGKGSSIFFCGQGKWQSVPGAD
jgi:hypothetical protein